MKWLILLLLLASLYVNGSLVRMVKDQYRAENAVRLNPLQLDVYPDAPAHHPGQKRVVFFGDSRALSWPAPAVPDIEFINRGIGEQTSEQLRLRFPAHIPPLQADLVIMQLCVNDLKAIAVMPQQRDAIVQACQANLSQLVKETRAAGSEVLLTTVFPQGKVPLSRQLIWSDEVAPAIVEVNQFIQSLAGQGVYILDTYSLLQGEPERIRPEYSRDLLHLNADGYNALNRALAQWLTQYQGWKSQ